MSDDPNDDESMHRALASQSNSAAHDMPFSAFLTGDSIACVFLDPGRADEESRLLRVDVKDCDVTSRTTGDRCGSTWGSSVPG